MNTKKRLIFIFIIISLSFLGCNREQYLLNRNIAISKKDLLEFKNSFKTDEQDIILFLDENQTVEKLLEIIGGISYDVKYNKSLVLNKKSAEEDIDFYFETLKDCYAGYIPNGGEEKFETAKKSIKNEITDEINTMELEKIIKSNMSFVKDAHFTIGNNIDTTLNTWYMVNNLVLGKDSEGYFDLSNGKYLLDIDKIDFLLKPSLSKNNSLQYKFFSQSPEEFPKAIKYKDGTSTELKYKPINAKYNKDSKVIFKKYDKVSYLKFSNFFLPSEGNKAKKVLDAIDEMAEMDYGILDLRGNPGGDGILANQIFQHYTGEKAIYSSDTIYILNSDVFGDSENGQTWEEYIKYSNAEIYGDNHTIERHSNKIIHKDGLLIVLTDSETASGAEKLIDALHHLDNTIFIGTPTKGCVNSSSMCSLSMKNSGINFTFGNIWNMLHEDYFQEYRGFLPDIWMTDVNVERLVELLNSYLD